MPFDTVDTSELQRLDDMLRAADIPFNYTDEPMLGGATIKIPDADTWKQRKSISVIQMPYSMGGKDGLLELWVWKGTREHTDPRGWLKAEECMEIIREEYRDGL